METHEMTHEEFTETLEYFFGEDKPCPERKTITHNELLTVLGASLGEQNMPNIKITAEVDGKQVPLETVSTETFEAIKALEKPKEIPVSVARLADHIYGRRLIFKVTQSIANRVGNYVAVDLVNGHVRGYWSGKDDGKCGSEHGFQYRNITII